MHFCPFTHGCVFLEQSHHTTREPSSHVKGQPTGVIAKSPSCYHDRQQALALRHVMILAPNHQIPFSIWAVPADNHVGHKYAVPDESFPGYRFVSKINDPTIILNHYFKPVVWGAIT